MCKNVVLQVDQNYQFNLCYSFTFATRTCSKNNNNKKFYLVPSYTPVPPTPPTLNHPKIYSVLF